MNKTLYILILVLALGCNSSHKTTKNVVSINPTTYANTITQKELKEYLYTYASNEFEGRETGMPGQKKAVAFLKNIYKNLNISAAKVDGDYFQKVPLEYSKLPDGYIKIHGNTFNIGSDFISYAPTEGNYSEIVYAGYGIEDQNYSDYKNINVKGKVILIKSGEPIDKNGNYIISGSKKKSAWSNMSESISKRIELANKKGAKALLFYDTLNFNRLQSRFNFMKENQSNKMVLQNDVINNFTTIFINSSISKAILPNITTENNAKKITTSISFNIKNSSADINSENVIAYIKGSTKPNEYIILSSHLDHIGINTNGEINNGADDDGSGTVALLEIAEAFKKAKKEGNGPERSIVFLHVTGEEKGLLGSKYYTDYNPIFPLKSTVANLNIDMIGRIDPKRKGNRNYIYLIGSDKLSTELHNISEQVNEKYTNIELDYTYNRKNDPNRFYYRSDH